MHRTEGAYNKLNMFTNGPPGTRLEKEWLNTIQEEIANVIEEKGISLKIASNDTHDQLVSAIAGSFYYVDYHEIEQGITGDRKTLKALVDIIGSNKATIYLRHNRENLETIYTLTTNLTIPSNITLKRENGAILDGAGTLTVNGPFESGLSQAFGSSITIAGLKIAYPEWWEENTIPDTTDMTTAIQAAIDCASTFVGSKGGSTVKFSDEIYIMSGITLKSRVTLVGVGIGGTVIKLKDSANADVIIIPISATITGIRELTVDGNKANNSSGNGIVFAEPTSGSEGDSFEPWSGKVSQAEYSYKYFNGNNIAVGNCADDGIFIAAKNFAIKFNNVTSSHNDNDGIRCNASDNMFINFWCEKNGRAGLYAAGGSNKFLSGKCIWNGRTDNTLAGIYITSNSSMYIGVEAQDNYCDGFLISGKENQLYIDANQNGYSSVGNEDTSSRIHANIRIAANTRNTVLIARCGTYKTVVESDGFWTTEYPYYINSSAATFSVFHIDYDPNKFNASPNIAYENMSDSPLLSLRAFSNDETNTFFDMDPKSLDASGDKIIRFFRNTESGGASQINIYVPGTSAVQHILQANGNAQLCQSAGDVLVGGSSTGGAWNTRRLRLGPYYLWIDSTGDLRIKNGAPTSDTDGTVVGTQT